MSNPLGSPSITVSRLAAELTTGEPPIVLAISRRRPGRATFDVSPDVRVPGAYAVDFDELTGAPQPGAGDNPLPDEDQVRRLVGRCGIQDGSRVVVYSADEPSTATRAWWVLRWAGLGDVAVLDGGLGAWVEAGHPTSDDVPKDGSGTASLRLGSLPTVDADGAALLARSGRLVDARGGAAFRGEASDQGRRAGHVPGAVSVPSQSLLREGRLRGRAELASLLTPLLGGGAVYCGSGVAATVVVHALHTLGAEAALYAGSWSAWSSEGRPAATGAA